MPRKPKLKKTKINVLVSGKSISVTLHPPTSTRPSWYAYWTGLVTSKSTGHSDLDAAVKAIEAMLQNGGRKSSIADLVLTDEEFDEIQRRHYGKKRDPSASERAKRSLTACMEAISAFRQISGVSPISLATPEDCERFQDEALKLPKNWRVTYADNPSSRKRREERGQVELISPTTVVRWSRALRAAFERANRNAGQKCVRSVVPNEKLLSENPWKQFSWVEERKRTKRRFDQQELLSLLEYFEQNWPGLPFAPAFLKVCLWSWGRREEISSLKWEQVREIGREKHFDSVGKWGVRKWFRVPAKLFGELESLRSESPYVFGCYAEQLREFYLSRGRNSAAHRVSQQFNPENVGEWMYRQVSRWSQGQPNGPAYLHIFRKTSLQYARSGEDVNRQVATDASLTTAVMMASYADESDEELRHKSNRTHRRIRASLPVAVASRYGCEEKPSDILIERMDAARAQEDWSEVARLCQELSNLPKGDQPGQASEAGS